MLPEDQLAWVTLAAGIACFFVVAGPGSVRPFSERLLVWSVGGTLVAASVPRLVAAYDPTIGLYAGEIGTFLMMVTRYLILLVCVYMILRWIWRCNPCWQTPREHYENFMASHKR